MSYTQKVTVTDKVLLVKIPGDIVLMRTVGETRSFTVPADSDIVVTETGSLAFPVSSSWVAAGVTEAVPHAAAGLTPPGTGDGHLRPGSDGASLL